MVNVKITPHRIFLFEYFPPNNDIHIRFMAILKAEYYSNIQVFGSEYFLTLVLKITGSTGIKGAFFLF